MIYPISYKQRRITAFGSRSRILTEKGTAKQESRRRGSSGGLLQADSLPCRILPWCDFSFFNSDFGSLSPERLLPILWHPPWCQVRLWGNSFRGPIPTAPDIDKGLLLSFGSEKSRVAPANQAKGRSVHELFAGAFRNKSSMWIVLVFLRKITRIHKNGRNS